MAVRLLHKVRLSKEDGYAFLEVSVEHPTTGQLVNTWGLVDTGAARSAITLAFAQRVGLPLVPGAMVRGAGLPARVRPNCAAKLRIPSLEPAVSFLPEATWPTTENVLTPHKDANILIGVDVLSRVVMVWDGPRKTVRFEHAAESDG